MTPRLVADMSQGWTVSRPSFTSEPPPVVGDTDLLGWVGINPLDWSWFSFGIVVVLRVGSPGPWLRGKSLA